METKNKEILEIDKVIFDRLIEIASKSTCHRSKCGSLLVSKSGKIIGEGYNSMPCNEVFSCFKDSLSSGFKSDKTCCVHAEQRAIMDALKNNPQEVEGSSLLFIRLDDSNNPKHSGSPYCTICSKMALDAGVSKFALWHKEGWTFYDSKYYNEYSFEYSGN